MYDSFCRIICSRHLKGTDVKAMGRKSLSSLVVEHFGTGIIVDVFQMMGM
jgi:hypothetical protein